MHVDVTTRFGMKEEEDGGREEGFDFVLGGAVKFEYAVFKQLNTFLLQNIILNKQKQTGSQHTG